MGQAPATRPTLLVRMRERADDRAWAEFVEVYGPLVYSYGRHRGLQDADASDLVQEVLRAVASALASFRYDPGRGSFRGWLLTVTRNELGRLLQRLNRGVTASGGTTHLAILAEHPDQTDDTRWEREHRERLFAWAVERVRPGFQAKTWEAFTRTYVEHQSPEAVAQALGMTAGAVYIARSRVLSRMREVIVALEGEAEPTRGAGA